MTSEENADIGDFDTTTTIPHHEDPSDSDGYITDNPESPDQQEIQVQRVLRSRRVNREEDNAPADKTISTVSTQQDPQQAPRTTSQARSSSPRKRQQQSSRLSDIGSDAHSVDEHNEQTSTASPLDNPDYSSPTERERLNPAPYLKPTDPRIPSDALNDILNQLEQLRNQAKESNETNRAQAQELEATKQKLQALQDQVNDQVNELRTTNHALEQQQQSTNQALKTAHKELYDLQQEMVAIRAEEKRASKVMINFVDELYKDKPELTPPVDVRDTERFLPGNRVFPCV